MCSRVRPFSAGSGITSRCRVFWTGCMQEPYFIHASPSSLRGFADKHCLNVLSGALACGNGIFCLSGSQAGTLPYSHMVKPEVCIPVYQPTLIIVSRLHTVFAFTRPAVSQDMGQDMAQWQQDVLKRLAAPDSDDTQVSQIVATSGF